MTAPSPGGAQRWTLDIGSIAFARADGDLMRYEDHAKVAAKITEERDASRADNLRLRKALELASRVVQSFANAERFEAINEARLDLIDDLHEALRGAAGEVK